VRPVRATKIVLLACLAALTVGALAAAPAEAKGDSLQRSYANWRKHLRHHGVHVGRNLLPQVRASDGTSRPPTATELRRSIHRMHRRWSHWLRATAPGQAVWFKLNVRAKVPAWGTQQLRSIAACESHGNPRAVGGGGAYRGMYQFSVSTWSVVGGTGDPAAASRWEQTWRAWLLLSRHGPGHWPNCA
jgi:Transglycosylase-like domain